MSGKPVVYLAGPEVFLANAADIGTAKIEICGAHGFDAVFPLVQHESATTVPTERGHQIFQQCIEMLEGCDLLIANMTPFRGVSVDAGTAVEIGYVLARGRPVLGYTNVIEDYEARVPPDSFSVESFGFADNLMCEGPVWQSGGSVVRTRVAASERLTDLHGFIACVEQAATLLGVGDPRP